MDKIPNIIDFIYFREIGNALDGENIDYLITNEGDHFIVNDIKNLKQLSNVDFLAYDYNKLSIYNQIRYEKLVHTIKKVDINTYSITNSKKLIKNKHLFT